MLTHVEFRSTGFAPDDTETDKVNPGRYGKRVAEYLAEALRFAGEQPATPVAEDWGWMLPHRPTMGLILGIGGLTAIMWIRRAHYGSGIAKSRQILRAKSSLMSEWRGTADERLTLRFTKIE